MLVLLACLAAAVVVGIDVSKRAGRQLVWLASGGALLLAATIGLAAAATRVRRTARQTMSAGVWLTAWQRDGECGYLPVSAHVGGATLDRLAGRMLAKVVADPSWIGRKAEARAQLLLIPGPKWLIAGWRPITDAAAPELMSDVVAADPSIGAMPAWEGRQVGDLFAALRSRPGAYHGAVYGPVPADHPAAPTVYNRASLSLVASKLTADGVLLVHASCRGPNAAPVLAVARTVEDVLGPSVVAVRTAGGGIEALIAASKSNPESWLALVPDVIAVHMLGKATCVDGSDLAAWADRIATIDSPAAGTCAAGAFLSTEDLAAYVESASVKRVASPEPE